MKGEPITTKFEVDISELKANIQEANRQIRLANSEFKAASSGMDDWANSADGLSAKIKQLTTVQSAQETKLKALKQQYQMVAEEQGENSVAAQNLMIKINNQQAALNKTTSELNSYNQKLDELENSSDAASSALDDTGRAANDLSGNLRNADNAADAAGDGFTVLKGTLASLIADGIRAAGNALKDFVVQSNTAYSKFQAQTGASTEEMKAFKDEMNDLYKSGVGESLQDIGDKMAYVKQVTGEIDPTKLKELTRNAMTLEDTFGSDFNETIRGVSNLMDHFGITSEEAFDLFAKGSQLGLDYTDELGDNIAEYGGNFQQAGYSAEEYFQLLVNGSQNGAYNLDKVNDSINEVKNRLGDGTIGKNISMFSAETQNLFHEWENGNATMKDVIDSIVGDINDCTNEQEALTMAATAFGTMGEDANLKVIKSLTSTGDAFNNVKGTMDEMNQIRYDNVTSQISNIGRTLQLEVLAPVAEQILPVVKDGVSWLTQNLSFVESAIVGIGTAIATYLVVSKIMGFVNAFQAAAAATEGLTVAQWLLNAAMSANPFVLIATLIAGVVAALITLWNTNEDFRNAVTEIWNSIMSVIGPIIDSIVNFFTVTIPQAIQDMITWFQNIPENISNFLNQAWTTVTTWVGNMVAKALELGQQFLQNIITFFQQLPYNIGYLLGMVIGTVASWVINMVNYAIQTGQQFLQNIVTFFQQLPTNIANFLTSAISAVSTWVGNMINYAIQAGSQFVSNVISFISSLPGQVASWLSNVVSSAASFVSNFASKAVQAASNFASNLVNGLASLPGQMISIGSDIVSGIWEGISGAAGWLMGQIQSFASGIVDGIKDFFSIGSPSKLMADEIGKWLPPGIGIGVKENAKAALQPMQKLASNMIDEAMKMKEAMNLDDMKVKLSSSVGSLKSKLSSSAQAVREQAQQVRDIVFNQYNNSPKSLSRLEIYRQTKSQLFAAKRSLKYV